MNDWLSGGAITAWLLGAIVAAAYLIGALIWWRVLVSRRRKRHEREDTFVRALIVAVEKNSLPAVDELVDLYRAHFDAVLVGVEDRVTLSQLVRRAVHRLASDVFASTDRTKKTLPQLRELLRQNEEALKQEERRVPFSGAPTPERQLLEDVLELTTGDKESIRTKLTELARAASVRQQTIDRLGDEGKQSLRWAKWGLFGTVLFSLLSIALAVWGLFREP